MPKRYALSLFIFRRDLRLPDNTGLAEAMAQSDRVIPAFILDPRQLNSNRYRSDNAVQFMARSLSELDSSLEQQGARLLLPGGEAEKVVGRLLKEHHIDAVFLNRDYTPFSRERDDRIAAVCSAHGRAFRPVADLLLHPPDLVLKSDGTPYAVFTPYFRQAQQIAIADPRKLPKGTLFTPKQTPATTPDLLVKRPNPELAVKGGRLEGLRILKSLGRLADYATSRDIPALAATTMLSAHLKFGTISVREAHAAISQRLGEDHPLLRQLYWRDFFTQIAFHFPHVFGGSFNRQYDAIRWLRDDRAFAAWCDGRSGVPIVDAGMRQLNRTGFMHNRVRMIAASFLVKDLHVDWRLGENYFAQKLVDYDPAVNNGNWQWAASTGCDAVPYFRIFNPWVQQKRFDPDCRYIRTWVPELAELPSADIHRLHLAPPARRIPYSRPIVDHERERMVAIQMFRTGRQQLPARRTSRRKR